MKTGNKIICAGRNYVAHAEELKNPVPESPVFFMKPFSCIVPMAGKIFPSFDLGEVHYELEIYVEIGENIPRLSDPGKVKKPIAALGLALDLTLRTLQEELKKNGLPWEKAKCFDGACPISDKIPFHEGIDLTDIGLRLYKNGQLTQSGNSKEMLFPITELIRHATQYFSLNKGDIILTGTPAGVGKIMENDSLVSQLIVNDTIILEVKSEVRAQSIRLKSDE